MKCTLKEINLLLEEQIIFFECTICSVKGYPLEARITPKN